MTLLTPLQTIAIWHAQEKMILYPTPPARLIMGCPLWGEPYVSRFIDWCLPSILASRDELNAAGWELILYAQEGPEMDRLAEVLRRNLVPAQIRELPLAIMNAMKLGGVTKYWLLAALQHLLVLECGRRGAGFHMLVGDVVYSDGYFGKLLRLAERYDGIIQGGLTIDFKGADPLLSKFRRGPELSPVLAVPAADLGQIGWENLVGEWKSWTMDGIEEPFAEMPNSHYIHWRTKNAVRIHCAHMSAIWISPTRCAAVTPMFGGTIDSELPRYVGGGEIYAPAVTDQMAYVALDDSRSEPTPRTSFAEFKAALMKDYGGQQPFWQLFKTPCWVPARPVGGFPDECEVELRFQRLMARLEET